MTTTAPHRAAVFVDRDNTLIRDPGYLRDPEQVQLLAGVPEALTRLREAGMSVIVVTNQSGVARGYLTEEEVRSIHERMKSLLAVHGAGVDAIYYCPYLDGPEAVRAEYRVESDLRKPKPGMLHLAAREHGIDLSRSWMVGDSERDVEAGRAAGCRTVLLASTNSAVKTLADHVAVNLAGAADLILDSTVPSHRPPSSSHAAPSALETRQSEPPSSLGRSDSLLREIVDELRMLRRERRHAQFSFVHLAGAIAQAFALCALGWGLFAAVNGATEAAVVRLLASAVFQILALTGFASQARR